VIWSRAQFELAARVDTAFRDAVLLRRRRRAWRAHELEAFCRRFVDEHVRPEWLGAPEPFFAAPRLEQVTRTRHPASSRERAVVDVRFLSEPALVFDDVGPKLRAHRENRFAHARLLLHPERARPAVVLLHGYMGGMPAFEERFWSASSFFRRGLHVALFALPFHGPRKGGAPWAPPAWPSADFRMTVEGFRQAIHDLRALRLLLAAEGATAVGAMGMSLGGYVTALLATAEPELAFAVPHIPLASIPDFMRDGGQIPGTPAERERLHALLEEMHAVISPLRRPVLVPPGGRMVIAGAADRITPLAHSERLAAHFGVPVTTFDGGHLMQLGRGRAFELALGMLERQGLLPPEPISSRRGRGGPA
jgi:pimeloyl-ACP methyl ester carboxylesterase